VGKVAVVKRGLEQRGSKTLTIARRASSEEQYPRRDATIEEGAKHVFNLYGVKNTKNGTYSGEIY